MSKTPVILVLVTNKQSKVLEHSQFFRVFSVFGTIQKILIFERKIIWKVFVEYESHEAAQRSLNLDGTLFENMLKMRVHLSQRESLTFQPNNNCGVDYSALASKQQFFSQLKEDSNSLNQQLQSNLANMNMLMCQLSQLQTGNFNQQDLAQQLSLLNQIKEYRNQAQQLTVLYQQQLRNYSSVLHREGKKNQQNNTSSSILSPSPSPIPYLQSTQDSISRNQILEECNESSSSSDEEFRHSDGESVKEQELEENKEENKEDPDQDLEDTDNDNYDDVFGVKEKLISYNSPNKEQNSPSPYASTPYTATPSPYCIPTKTYVSTPIPKFQQKAYILVQHPITNLRVLYNLFSTFAKIEQMFQSLMGAIFQLSSLEEATHLKELLNNKPLLGVPMNLIISLHPSENAQLICLPQLERKPFIHNLSNTLLVSGLQNVSKEQLIQYFGYMTPVVSLKYLSPTQCKIQYQDIGCSLSVLGHFQDIKVNGRSLQLSFTPQ